MEPEPTLPTRRATLATLWDKWNRYGYCSNQSISFYDENGFWRRKEHVYDKNWVNKELKEIQNSLTNQDKSMISKFITAIMWHAIPGQKDYKKVFDFENLVGPESGDINKTILANGVSIAVEYFDVPGFGELDPEEYGNYLTGYSAGFLDSINSNNLACIGVVFGGRLYSISERMVSPFSRNQAVVTESVHDERSFPYFLRGYNDAMCWYGVNEPRSPVKQSGN
ncbi:hypothetical protein JW905_02275 [bacterium]|nr:hypothetical protein [candidate division CSSED10-310 bacterium]